MPGRPALLVLVLTATLAAFGGIYSWALAPILIGVLLFALTTWGQPAPSSSDSRSLDFAIAAFVAAISIQLVPLPGSVRSTLSPSLLGVERSLRPDAALRGDVAGALSLDPIATAQALALVIAAATTYVSARRMFSVGGVRQVCHALSLVGMIAAIGAILQRALTPRLIYGFWAPSDPGAVPFGTVVNRNHFAAWLLMVSALTAGYLVARTSRRARQVGGGGREWRRKFVTITQSPVSWTAASWMVITLTVFAAQSRSALVGLAVAGATLLRTVTHTWKPVIAAAFGILVIAIALLTAGEATTTRIAERMVDTLEVTAIDRVAIWREAMPIVNDFSIAGVGAGAFGRAMLAYQRTRLFVPHLGMEWHFNHAHNHYLQLAAEGGLLLTVPFAVVVLLFLRLVARRLREDAGELRAVRLGAVAGLAAVATQSVWEVPLTMPAAALLAATLAALATYQRVPDAR